MKTHLAWSNGLEYAGTATANRELRSQLSIPPHQVGAISANVNTMTSTLALGIEVLAGLVTEQAEE